MEGRALIWYNWLMDSGYVGGWEDFISALKTRFAPFAFDDPVGAFTKLKQTSIVEDYQTQFEILSNKIQGLSEEFKVSIFLSGFREEIRITVTMLKPKDLTTAFGLARLQEEEVKLRGRSQKYTTWASGSQSYPKLSSTSTLPRITPPTSDNRSLTPSYNSNLTCKPSISLHPLAGAVAPKTMRLLRKIGGATGGDSC
jgi:hypothetical protein